MSALMSRLLRRLRPNSPRCVACGGIPTRGNYHWDWFGRAYCLCEHCWEQRSA
jgi:hypothetical protein